MKARPGFTLAETLVALVLVGIIGTALTRLMVNQSGFFNKQGALSDARDVARAATNIVMSDLRMVNPAGGIVALGPDSITVRVPYRMGLVCGHPAGRTTISWLPADSIVLAEAVPAGYAWQAANGTYNYVEAAVTQTSGSSARCSDAATSITTLSGGAMTDVAPQVSGAPVATPVFLFQRITYRFANSTMYPGTKGLYRQLGSGTPEELAAPFDASSRFRFYVLDADTAQNDVPSPVTDLRGLELQLVAMNRMKSAGTAETTPLSTAVFFRNRLD